MTDEIRGGIAEAPVTEIADQARQDQADAATRERDRRKPLTAEDVREIMTREGGTESARAMASDLESGNTREALRRINPNITAENLELEVENFDLIKKRELDDAGKNKIIDNWKRLGTTQEEAKMIIDASAWDSEEKAVMMGRIQELEEGTDSDRDEEIPRDEAARTDAQIEELQEQINDAIDKSPADEAEKQGLRDKMSGILEKFNGKTGKRVVKWGTWTLGGLIIALLLLVLLEAKALGSVTGSSGGAQRRH